MGVRRAALGLAGRKGSDVGRPIFFLVNDQEQALRELAGELDRRFGADYQILSEQSPDKALTALGQLARGLSGENLTNRAVEQAWLFGANFVSQQVTGLGVRGSSSTTDRLRRNLRRTPPRTDRQLAARRGPSA